MRSSRPRVVLLIVATLAWGALAFGAVYPWAYWPLLASCAAAGLIGLVTPPPARGPARDGELLVGLAVLLAAVALQLVPLSPRFLAWVSPATDAFLRRFDLSYAGLAVGARVSRWHALSIRPDATWRGLAFLMALSLFLVGTSRSLSGRNLRVLVHALIALSVLLALVGIIQKPLYHGAIYGFWRSEYRGDVFGPFVNRNHFAGWMLMAIPLATGYFCGLVGRGMEGSKPAWRNRILWFSSPEASRAILTAFSIVLMGLSLVLTLSRSGIACFVLTALLTGWLAIRRQPARSHRLVAAAYLGLLVLVTIGWVGIEAVAGQFAAGPGSMRGGRTAAWDAAVRIVRDFPLTGTGLNTYGTAMISYQGADLDRHYVEAHNDYLQLAAEGGVLLITPAVLVAVALVRQARRRLLETSESSTTRWIRLGALIGLVGIGVQEIVDFSLQIPANAALFALLWAIAVHRLQPDAARVTRSSRGLHLSVFE